jgi:hemolysin III
MQVFSACYHAQSLDDTEDRRFWAKVDLLGIGLGIVGTFSTMALLILEAPWSTVVIALGTAWAVTGAAVAIRARKHIQGSPGKRTAIYIGVTFVPAALMLGRTFAVRPSAAGWLLAALVLFVAGGLVYVLRRPRLRPAVFGFHELFHAITIAGLSAAYCCLWLLVR